MHVHTHRWFYIKFHKLYFACGLTVKHASCADVEVFFDPTSYTVSEEMNAALTIRANTSSHSFPFAVTVETMNITAVAGEDYTPGGYTVSFQPGQDVATLVVPTIDDTTVEIEEFYRATIVNTSESRVVIGSSDMANVTILDNEESEPAHFVIWHTCASIFVHVAIFR